MASAADIAAEMDEGLKALFQAGLELGLQVQADAMCADSAQERGRLALSFHRISRSVRQTAALRMKIARDAERSGHEATAQVVSLEKARTAKRATQVTAAVQSLIWSETESDEDEQHLRSELEDLLDIEAQDDETFLSEPLDAQVHRLAHRIGLQGPPPQGEVSPKATEGVEAPTPGRPASQPPQSLRDSSPSGEASENATPHHPVVPRSGGTPDPGDPSRRAEPSPQLGSPASHCGRAEDDDGYWGGAPHPSG